MKDNDQEYYKGEKVLGFSRAMDDDEEFLLDSLLSRECDKELLCVDVKEFLNAVVGRSTEKKKLTQKASEHDAPNFAKTYSKKFSEFNFKENGYVLFFIIDNFLFLI